MYQIEYSFNGKKYSSFINATSWEDAESKIKILPSFIKRKFSDFKIVGKIIHQDKIPLQINSPEFNWIMCREYLKNKK